MCSRNFSFLLKNYVFFRDGHAISIPLFNESTAHVPCSHSPIGMAFFQNMAKIVTLSCYNSGTKSVKQNSTKNLLSNFFALSESVKTYFGEIGTLMD